MYTVKEIFLTLQGEGHHTGRPAVFCRFSGCNLWTGRETTRASAVCRFCDTDFVGTDGPGGGIFGSADDLADAVLASWGDRPATDRFVVCTGGEPLLQLDPALIADLHDRRFEIAVETNGTRPVPEGIDWLCVSPKAGSDVIVRRGNELKLVFPQAGADPECFVDWEFDRFSLQPMDGPRREANTRDCIDYCLAHPRWRLSLQTHKVLGIA